MLVHDHVPGLHNLCYICENEQNKHAGHPDAEPDIDNFFDDKLLDQEKLTRPSMVDQAATLKR
jgi:hypothetical protein